MHYSSFTPCFRDRKEEYREKIIDCADSPTGKAYIGINKVPLMPAVDKGHGFQGVLLQDDNRELIQCHSCGAWKKKITTQHLQKCAGLTISAYKKKYGLNVDLGLVSDTTSLRLTENALENKTSTRNKFKPSKGFGKHGRSEGHRLEFFNKFGTCPLQLKTRLYEFIRCNRELPSQRNRGRTIYKALVRRYGSYGHALAVHGLPYMKRRGTNMRYAFSDGTVYTFNLNQMYDREALFKMMMQKCPVLSPATHVVQ